MTINGYKVCADADGVQARYLAYRVALAVCAVVAELPRAAQAPALDAAAVESSAGVAVAGRDGDGAGAESAWGRVRQVAHAGRMQGERRTVSEVCAVCRCPAPKRSGSAQGA